MNKVFFIFGLLCLSINLATCKKVVCYYTNWAQYRPAPATFTPDNIDPFVCDVIIYSFLNLVNNNLVTLEWNDDAMIAKVVALKQTNPNLKVTVALGGFNFGSAAFSNLVTDSAARQTFVASVVQFLRARNLDGFDVDWEYPAVGAGSRSTDKQLFTTLLSELRTAFTPYNLTLTAAVAAGTTQIDVAYDVPNIAPYLDWINLMTYDLHGPWDSYVGGNAPLYARSDESGFQLTLNVNYSVQYWISKGFPREKIMLGMGAYGRSFALANSSNYQPGAASVGAGTAGPYLNEAGFSSYNEICGYLNSGYTKEWNAQQLFPFIHSGNQWIGYDNVTSLNYKADYVNNQGLAGAMFWAIDLDDFSGTFCNTGRYPLISAVRQRISSTATTVATTIASTTVGTTIATTATTKTTTVVGTTTTAPTSSLCYKGAQFYANVTSSCQNYYRCVTSGSSYVIYYYTCTTGTIFNEVAQYCDWPFNVNCAQATTTTAGTTTAATTIQTTTVASTTATTKITTTAASTTATTKITTSAASTTATTTSGNPCYNGDMYYGNQTTGCQTYYRCVNGVVVQYFACSTGTLFSSARQYCDWTYNNPVC